MRYTSIVIIFKIRSITKLISNLSSIFAISEPSCVLCGRETGVKRVKAGGLKRVKGGKRGKEGERAGPGQGTQIRDHHWLLPG